MERRRLSLELSSTKESGVAVTEVTRPFDPSCDNGCNRHLDTAIGTLPQTRQEVLCRTPRLHGISVDEFEDARNAASEIALVGMARDLAQADLKAVRTGIGAALRTFYSDVLSGEIPEKIAELLDQLDQQLKRLEQQRDADST